MKRNHPRTTPATMTDGNLERRVDYLVGCIRTREGAIALRPGTSTDKERDTLERLKHTLMPYLTEADKRTAITMTVSVV